MTSDEKEQTTFLEEDAAYWDWVEAQEDALYPEIRQWREEEAWEAHCDAMRDRADEAKKRMRGE